MRTVLAFTVAIWLGIQSVVLAVSKAPVAEAGLPNNSPAAAADSFRFISWGDAQDENGNLADTAGQAASLNPAFTIFNGDLENEGVDPNRMDIMTASFGSLLPETFLVRGNHDDHVSGSAGLWEDYFTAVNRPLPSGVTNYVAMNSTSTYLNYSFDYGNARFIGLDVPGEPELLTSSQYTFLDNRLTEAESLGLTHAFIFFHGPEYCVESTHCNCSTAADGSCTPSAFINVINQHPIVSATFHGHEHIMGWVHMDNSRLAGLARSYEEFITSPSGGWTYNDYMYPARMDYYYPDMGSSQGFAAIDVSGGSFTVSLYKVGTASPVWSHSFTKPGQIPTATPNTKVTATRKGTAVSKDNIVFLPLLRKGNSMPGVTPAPTQTNTRTVAQPATPTRTPTKTSTPKATATRGSGIRQLKYYMADRVINNADFSKLAGWGINTAMVDFDVNGSETQWRAAFTEAAKYNIDIVIWPSDWNDPRPNCDWEAPYPVSANGDISKVKRLLDVATQYSNFIGIINGHESFWTCTNMTFDEMAGLKTQLKAYALSKGRDIKIWNYINGLYSETGDPAFPASEIPRVMDVAIIWKHCAGNAEGSCDSGSYSALAQIQHDRARLTAAGLDGTVELVYIIQTFTASWGYDAKFTLSELENYSCEFLNTSALDGFGFYTWDAGWWPDLHEWPDLQPGIPYIHDNCALMAP